MFLNLKETSMSDKAKHAEEKINELVKLQEELVLKVMFFFNSFSRKSLLVTLLPTGKKLITGVWRKRLTFLTL